FPVTREILNMYSAQGKEPPKELRSSVMYNRGVLQAAVHIEGIRNALKANGGKPPTGEQVKNGLEQISGFTLGGLVPPLKMTPQDHEGGGWVKIYQVKGGALQPVGDWFQGYPAVLEEVLKAELSKS